MDWIVLSMASAAAFTAYTLLQKRALDGYVGPVAFSAVAGMVHIGIAAAILIVSPPDWFSWSVAAMAMAGLVQAGVQLLSAYALRRSADVSRIVPVLDAYPLLVMAMAVLVLGEALTPMKWGAGLMVIAGVAVAAFSQTLPGKRLSLDRSVAAVLTASLGIAVYAVLAKSVAGQITVWQMYAISWMFALPGVLAAARVSSMAPVLTALRSRRALLAVALAQAPLLVAFWTGLTAIEQGPVSLATAIMSTRPVLILLWVAAAGMSLHRVFEKRETFREARARWGSAALVTLGVGVMAF